MGDPCYHLFSRGSRRHDNRSLRDVVIPKGYGLSEIVQRAEAARAPRRFCLGCLIAPVCRVWPCFLNQCGEELHPGWNTMSNGHLGRMMLIK